MTADSEKKQERAVSRDRDTSVSNLLLSMADTTWRMFTPPALTVSGGIWVDLKYHTKPWVTIVAAVVGLGLSVLLVKKQLGGGQ